MTVALGSDPAGDADVRVERPRGSRCVVTQPAATPRQRQPRFPDTPWGRLRRATGWSLRELAERSGVNIADLSRIERTSTVNPTQARRLLAVYDEPSS